MFKDEKTKSPGLDNINTKIFTFAKGILRIILLIIPSSSYWKYIKVITDKIHVNFAEYGARKQTQEFGGMTLTSELREN
jgi:hypothetical protein